MTRIRRLARALTAATGTGAAATLALGLLAGFTVFAAVAGPRQSLGVRTQALQRMFAAAPAAERSVQAAADWQRMVVVNSGTLAAADLSVATGQFASALAAAGLPLAAPAADWASLTTSYNPVSGEARSAQASAGVPPQLEIIFSDSLRRNSRLVSGGAALPPAGRGAAGGPATLGVSVTRATAARFGLRPGGRLMLAVQGRPVTIVITGILQPASPAAAFWTVDPDAAAPSLNRPLGDAPPYWVGAAFAAPDELGQLQAIFGRQDLQVRWDVPLALGRVDADHAQLLENQLNHAVAQAGAEFPGTLFEQAGAVVSAGLTGDLATFVATQTAVQAILSLLFTGLTVIGAVVMLLAALMLTERRSAELIVLRARGASLRQLAALMLRGSALVTLPAAAAGAGLAVVLTPGDGNRLAWWLGGVTVLAALAGPVWATVRRHRAVDLAPDRALDQAATRRTSARRWVAEATLVAGCAAGLVVLRQQGLSAVGGVNVYTTAAPVLAAVPAALLVLRLYPLMPRGLLRLASPRAGAAGFVGLATAARAALSAALPAFALVLALAMTAFGGMIGATIGQGQQAASWRSVGADAAVDASQVPGGISAAAGRAVAAVPGVRRTAAAYQTTATVNGGTALPLAVVDPARYAALVAATPWPALPAVLPERGPPPGPGRSGPGGVVPVVASRAAVAALGRGEVRVPLGYGQVTIRVAATVSSTPAFPRGGTFVLLPMWALQRTAYPPLPTLLLVSGAHLDERALTAVVRRSLPGATVSYRSAVLAALSGAPLQHGADVIFAEGAALAAGFSVVVLLLGLATGARARDHALVRLRVLGLSRGQSRVLLAAETLPQVVAAVAGGLVCAWLLGPLIGPDLNLAVFTGSAASVPVRPDDAALALPAAGLVVLALAILAVQAALTARRGVAAALRVGG